MGLRLNVATSLAAIALMVPIDARPQELSREDARRFQELMKESGAAYRAEEYQRSVDLLEEAQAIYDHPDISYNMARARTLLDQCERAQTMYEAYIAREDTGEEDEEKARERIAELEATCQSRGTLAVQCTPATTVLSIDGAPSTPCPLETRVLAGERKVAASAVGYLPRTQTVTVREGETTDLAVALEVEPPPPPPSTLPLVGWSAVGAGAAMLVGGLAVDAGAARRSQRLREAAGNADQIESLRTAARRARAGTLALYGLGIASAATGAAILLVVAPRSLEGPPDVAIHFTTSFGAQSAGQ